MPEDRPEPARDNTRPGEWLDVLAPDVMNQFVGKHIAIVRKRVIAAGNSYEEVVQAAKASHPDEVPYIAYIPKR